MADERLRKLGTTIPERLIAIHDNDSPVLFHHRWVAYCEANSIPYKRVNCYANDIIEQLKGCDALMWHYHQNTPRDIVMAQPLLFALEQSGMKVFPDFNTAWHFDDKVGQKYLLEALKADLVPTWVFYDEQEALRWTDQTDFPKVFKLRGGAGSQNVRLVNSRAAARKLIRRAFGRGFPPYDAWGSLKERWRQFSLGKTGFGDIIKGLIRLGYAPPYARLKGNERNYLYFQEFLPGNDSDIRIVVIGDKAFGIKRLVRKNDFRASGSGYILYDKEEIDERCIRFSFDYSQRLKAQCVAYDYVFDANRNPQLVEVSYGFAVAGYDPCTGYWDENLDWHSGAFNPYGWMVEMMLK